jgi:predicted MFS family arabinose efflux permease
VAILIDGVSFGISALLVASLNPRRQTPLGNASFLQDLRLGWREFTSHTWLWVIVVQFSLVVAVWESVFGLLGPAVARDHMDGARDWGFIAASFGVGTLLGGLLSLKLKARYPMRFATFCTFAFCVLPLALAVPLPMPVVALAAIAQGVAGQIFVVLWNTTLQTKVPAQMLSRVSAYDHLGSIALAPLGIVAAGLLFEWLGFRATLLIAASTFVITTLVALCVRDVRMLTRSD